MNMVRVLSSEETLLLPIRKCSLYYWYAALLKDLPDDDVLHLLRKASLPGQNSSWQAAEALSAKVTQYLIKVKAIGKICFFNNKHHFFNVATKAVHWDDGFRNALQSVIFEHGAAYQLKIIKSIGCDKLWAKEYMGYLCSLALAKTQSPSGKKVDIFVAKYPFLETLDYGSPTARLYGRSQMQHLTIAANIKLQTEAYRNLLRRAVRDTINNAPPGRNYHWSVAAAAIMEHAHAMTIAEILELGHGLEGLSRARVLVSRVGQKIHDAYFRLLCAEGLMTATLAEFMTLEYGLPYEIVRSGLALVGIKNSHAPVYTKSKKEQVLL